MPSVSADHRLVWPSYCDAGGSLFQLQRGERGVVTANRNQPGHTEGIQTRQAGIEMLEFLRGVGTRRAEVGAAAEVNPTDILDRQALHLAGLAIHDPFEAILNADHVTAAENTPDRGGSDDTIDTGRRPTPH